MVEPLIDPYEQFWTRPDPLTGAPSMAPDAFDKTHQFGMTTPEEVALYVGTAARHAWKITGWETKLKAAAWIKEHLGQHLTLADLDVLGTILEVTFVPIWAKAAAPALASGMAAGALEVTQGRVPAEVLNDIATAYAKDLGKQLHETSYEALVQGYQSQVNRKVPTARALENVLNAYGVSPRTMNALVGVWTSEDPKRLTNQPTASVRGERVTHTVEADLKRRARTVGETEAWAARTQGKQIVWMYGMKQGVIPAGAKRKWITAEDEKVCKYCGPLHEMAVPVDQQFQTAQGSVWTPPLHPNCRCDITLDVAPEDMQDQLDKLIESERVHKAWGEDPYTRDRAGRFAETEGRRGSLTRLKTRDPRPVDPTLTRLFEEQRVRLGLPTYTEAVTAPNLSAPSLTEAPSLSGVKLSAPSLSPVQLATPTEAEAKVETEAPVLAPIALKAPVISPVAIEAAAPAIMQAKFANGWNKSDETLYALIEGYTAEDHGQFFLDDDDEVYVLSQDPKQRNLLNERLGRYWQRYADAKTEDFIRSNRGRLPYKDEGGEGWKVSEKAYRKALEMAINSNHDPDATVTLERDNRKRTVSAAKLADKLGMYEDVKDARPAVIAMKHQHEGMAKIRGQKGSRHFYTHANPGAFKAQGPARPGGIRGDTYSYNLFYVTPDEDLDWG